MILRVISPALIILVLLVLVGIVTAIVLIISSRAKHKAKADTLSTMLNSNQAAQTSAQLNDDEKLAKLERLNKLRQDGALSEEEFAREKAKVLG